MIRGTTPRHRFLVPFKASEIAALQVIYAQKNKVVHTRTADNTEVEDGCITVALTQAETLAFAHGAPVQLQLRVLTTAGEAYASRILTASVEDCLCEEVLT